MKRIVLDTNIIISALFWKGYPRKVYELVRTGKVIIVSCEEMMVEFIRVLGYSRFGLAPQEILPLVNNVRKNSHFVELKTKIAAIEEDPTDNIFLACAIDGEADYIISGDHHLLDLGSYEGVQIVRPKDFLIEKRLR